MNGSDFDIGDYFSRVNDWLRPFENGKEVKNLSLVQRVNQLMNRSDIRGNELIECIRVAYQLQKIHESAKQEHSLTEVTNDMVDSVKHSPSKMEECPQVMNLLPEKKKAAFRWAAGEGDIDTLKMLSNEKERRAVFRLAAKGGDVAMLLSLLQADSYEYEERKEAFFLASSKGHTDSMNILLSQKEREAALISAAQDGYLDHIEILLGTNLDVNARDENGETALIHAIRAGRTEAVKRLLNANANTEVRETSSGFGYTPLMLAVLNNDQDSVELLTKLGAYTGAKSLVGGHTALTLAVDLDRVDILEAILMEDPYINGYVLLKEHTVNKTSLLERANEKCNEKVTRLLMELLFEPCMIGAVLTEIDETEQSFEQEFFQTIFQHEQGGEILNKALAYAVSCGDSKIVDEIIAFCEKHSLISVLQTACRKLYTFNYGNTILSQAKLLEEDEIFSILSIKLFSNEPQEPILDARAIRAAASSLHAQLFDSIPLKISNSYRGGNPGYALAEILEDLLGYEQEIAESSETVKNTFWDVINEMNQAYRTTQLLLIAENAAKSQRAGNIREVALMNQELIKKLPFDPTASPLEAPSVLIVGGTKHHAVLYRIRKDSENTFAFSIINTGEGAESAEVSLEDPDQVKTTTHTKDIEYTGLALDEGEPEFLSEILRLTIDSEEMSEVLSFIDQSLLNEKKDNKKFLRTHHVQKKRTCFAKCITSYLRGRLAAVFGTHFKYWRTKRMVKKFLKLLAADVRLNSEKFSKEQLEEISSGVVAKALDQICKKRGKKALKDTEGSNLKLHAGVLREFKPPQDGLIMG